MAEASFSKYRKLKKISRKALGQNKGCLSVWKIKPFLLVTECNVKIVAFFKACFIMITQFIVVFSGLDFSACVNVK